jgi:hypothetical protein
LDDQGFGHRFTHPLYINATTDRLGRRDCHEPRNLGVCLGRLTWRWVSEQEKRRARGPAL